MAPTALMMIHLPYVTTVGDADELRKMASTLDRVKNSMVLSYQRHTPKSADQIEKLMAAETWFSADEAVDAGFAEKVLTAGDDDEDMAAGVDLSKFAAKFRNLPAPIAARFAGAQPVDRGVSETERARLSHRLALLKRLTDGC